MHLSVSRSRHCHQVSHETEFNQMHMRRIDEINLADQTWSGRMIRDYLATEGHKVNRKRIQRLMALMDIKVVYPKRNLSRRNHENKVYPYLLKGLEIQFPNQVWSTDITYTHL